MTVTNGEPRKGGFAGVMIVAAWLLLLGILTAYFSGWLERRENPNQLVAGATSVDGVREVLLEQNRWGHYVVTGKINGHPVKFLLDTGATNVSVPERVATKLGLEAGHQQTVETANGAITTFFHPARSGRSGNHSTESRPSPHQPPHGFGRGPARYELSQTSRADPTRRPLDLAPIPGGLSYSAGYTESDSMNVYLAIRASSDHKDHDRRNQ